MVGRTPQGHIDHPATRDRYQYRWVRDCIDRCIDRARSSSFVVVVRRQCPSFVSYRTFAATAPSTSTSRARARGARPWTPVSAVAVARRVLVALALTCVARAWCRGGAMSSAAVVGSGAGAGAGAAAVSRARAVSKTVLSREQSEGRGARVRRSIGNAQVRNFDPFLMLDEFAVGLPAGFSDHPHRGMITCTYVLPKSRGFMDHEDSMLNAGRLRAGDLQYMKAGRGILHAEVPTSEDVCHGLQLWITLPAAHKMDEPEYQELRAEELSRASWDGVDAIIIAGEAFGVQSQVLRTKETPVHYIHFAMAPGSELTQKVPPGWNSFAYTLEGSADFGDGVLIGPHHTVMFTNRDGEDGVIVKAGPSERAEFVLISGQPVGEPIEQHGPFVMNTREEINRAFADFQGAKNGFESARGWRSEIQYRIR